ncbi:Myozenin-2 [Labeo rohita]|uniref:Myozenin-2 n=1 Tax=Labeo rohita TaxID=84645 RepID=A0ABQ8M3E1_LABRO|nr:Myozenin-2 [Labeo rohita]
MNELNKIYQGMDKNTTLDSPTINDLKPFASPWSPSRASTLPPQLDFYGARMGGTERMQTAHHSLTKQRQQQAMKISVPKDVMMEELNLNTNRGSIMFQERQRRVERFTVENSAEAPTFTYNQIENQNDMMTDMQGGKENLLYPVAGKQSLVTTLKNTVAKKGSPNVLAPGYSGPLREIPREKFNATVIPKSYCSPWREALGGSEELIAAVPFGGPVRSQRVIPVIGFEALEPPNLSSMTLATMSKRRNFNRAPRGWGLEYSPESNDL